MQQKTHRFESYLYGNQNIRGELTDAHLEQVQRSAVVFYWRVENTVANRKEEKLMNFGDAKFQDKDSEQKDRFVQIKSLKLN